MNEEIVIIGGIECLPLKAAARYLGMTISSFYGTTSRYGLPTMNIPHTKNHRAVPIDELRKYQEARNSSRLSMRLGDDTRTLAPPDRPGSGSSLASSYAQNISMLYRHPATYMLLLTMVDDMTARGIPAPDAYKLAFEVAPTLLSELDKEEDIMQKTPREIINKVVGENHPAVDIVKSVMGQHGVNLDRPVDGSVPAVEGVGIK